MSNNQTLQTWADNYWKTIYPVGSIYQSMSTTSPASLFGGSWNPINGVFLLSNSDNYQNDDTGGEENVMLTIDTIPRHRHTMGNCMNASGNSVMGSGSITSFYSVNQNVETGYTGGNKAHNNMPPYLVCSMWRRVS